MCLRRCALRGVKTVVERTVGEAVAEITIAAGLSLVLIVRDKELPGHFGVLSVCIVPKHPS